MMVINKIRLGEGLMSVTIQQIADRAGVSRGTVDRALNNRGRINPEIEEKIKALAQEMGYVKKERKKKKQSNTTKIGVVTQLANSPFMVEVNRGIACAKHELQYMGVELILKESNSVDEEEQLKAIEELLELGIQGLAIMPVECETIRMKLNEVMDKEKIPVVTFNSDIVGTKRCCFVGMDNRKSGRTAVGLLGMLMKNQGRVLVITGYFSNHVDNQRVDGFIEEMKTSYPQMEIVGVHGSFDQEEEVEKIVNRVISDTTGVEGILVVSGGQMGVKRAFEKLKLKKRPYVIIYDQTPDNESLLREDVVDFLIDQNGYIQGYRPPHILVNLLLKGEKIKEEYVFTHIDIKTKYNL